LNHDPAYIAMGECSLKLRFESAKAQKNKNVYIFLDNNHLPSPGTDEEALIFWVYKQAGGATIRYMNLESAGMEGAFTAGPIHLDEDRWQKLVIKKEDCRHTGPVDWKDINKIRLQILGDFILYLDGFVWANPDTEMLEKALDQSGELLEIPSYDVTQSTEINRFDAEMPEKGYMIFSRSYISPVNSTSVPDREELTTSLRLFAAPGEYEPVTFSIRSGEALKDVRISTAGPLIAPGPDMPAIPLQALDIRTVTYMKRWIDSRYFEKRAYLLEKKESVDIEPLHTQRFWVTVKVPADALPGTYETQLIVTSGGNELEKLTLTLEVWPIELNNLPEINYFMYFRPERLPLWARTKEYWTHCLKDMKEHGITGYTAYVYPSPKAEDDPLATKTREGWLTFNETISALQEAGFGRDNPCYFFWIAAPVYAASPDPVKIQIAEKAVEAVSEAGFKMIFGSVDEPETEERIKTAKKLIARMREHFPDVPITTAMGNHAREAVGDLHDIWIFSAAALNDEVIQEAEAKGKSLWSYECALAPNDALTARHYFGYFLWKAGIKGASFWTYADSSVMKRYGGELRMEEEWNPEWTNWFDYVWPARDGVVPSVAWEAAREGKDDYRYLRTLENTIERAEKQGKDTSEAREFLKTLSLRVQINNYRRAWQHGRSIWRDKFHRHAQGFDRLDPEPHLSAVDYNSVRREAARLIMELQD
jgi:hypothetical protein